MPALPSRMQALPVDHRGYPVPYFVAWIDGAPDFRVADGEKLVKCVNERRCWLCGQHLGSYFAFVVGPMCSVNRVSSEPPSHRECAEFALRVCPFLIMPRAQRRDAAMPDEATRPAGIMIRRNPGVTMLWITKSYQPFPAPRPDGSQGALYRMGPPREVTCWAEGRTATRDEIAQSFDTGLPLLLEPAEKEGVRAVRQLETQALTARRLLGIAPLVTA